jgi:ferrochelatase
MTHSAPGVLLINFGGPRSEDELEPFLTELFDDVLPLPWPLRRPVAAAIASRRRLKVRENYARIGWSPLVDTTFAQLRAVQALLGDGAPPIETGMLYTEPTVDQALSALLASGVDSLIAIALFPQYSVYTTGSAFARVEAAIAAAAPGLPVHFVPAFHDHPQYIEALTATARRGIADTPGQGPIHLLFSPHGIPVSAIRKGDPYAEHVRETCRRVIATLNWTDPWHVSWQSRVGPTQWLTPSTLDQVRTLAAQGAQRLCVVPVSFVGEHIETLDELDIELAEVAREHGVEHYGRAPALGVEPAFIRCLADLIQTALADMTGYRCFRCLVPQPAEHRTMKSCERCGHGMPSHFRLPTAEG